MHSGCIVSAFYGWLHEKLIKNTCHKLWLYPWDFMACRFLTYVHQELAYLSMLIMLGLHWRRTRCYLMSRMLHIMTSQTQYQVINHPELCQHKTRHRIWDQGNKCTSLKFDISWSYLMPTRQVYLGSHITYTADFSKIRRCQTAIYISNYHRN